MAHPAQAAPTCAAAVHVAPQATPAVAADAWIYRNLILPGVSIYTTGAPNNRPRPRPITLSFSGDERCTFAQDARGQA